MKIEKNNKYEDLGQTNLLKCLIVGVKTLVKKKE